MITISLAVVGQWLLFIAAVLGIAYTGTICVVMLFVNALMRDKSHWQIYAVLAAFVGCVCLACYVSPFHL